MCHLVLAVGQGNDLGNSYYSGIVQICRPAAAVYPRLRKSKWMLIACRRWSKQWTLQREPGKQGARKIVGRSEGWKAGEGRQRREIAGRNKKIDVMYKCKSIFKIHPNILFI